MATKDSDSLDIITPIALMKMRASRKFFAGHSVNELTKVMDCLSIIIEKQKEIEAVEEKEKQAKEQKLKDILDIIKSEGVSVNDLTQFIEEVQPLRKIKKN